MELPDNQEELDASLDRIHQLVEGKDADKALISTLAFAYDMFHVKGRMPLSVIVISADGKDAQLLEAASIENDDEKFNWLSMCSAFIQMQRSKRYICISEAWQSVVPAKKGESVNQTLRKAPRPSEDPTRKEMLFVLDVKDQGLGKEPETQMMSWAIDRPFLEAQPTLVDFQWWERGTVGNLSKLFTMATPVAGEG